VHRSLLTGATNQIEARLAVTQDQLATTTMPKNREVVLPMQGDVVLQVTNIEGTKVWAASSPLQRSRTGPFHNRPLGAARTQAQVVRDSATASTLSQIDQGQVQPITTTRGPGIVYGFVYGGSIDHSNAVLMTSVTTSFPLLLLISGGLIWLGLGWRWHRLKRSVDAWPSSPRKISPSVFP